MINFKIAALVLVVVMPYAQALVCYNCTDCTQPGAQLSKIQCDGQCFVKFLFILSSIYIY